MNFNCHLSGVQYSLDSFSNIRISPKSYIHPAIIHYKDYLLSNNTVSLDNYLKLSPTERRLVYAASLYYSDLIIFNSPIEATDSIIELSFPTIYPVIAWTRNISPIKKSTLPTFRIDQDTKDLDTFISGYIPELILCRNDFRIRDRELALQDAINRLDTMARNRITKGLSPFTSQVVEYLFKAMGIPISDTEVYKNYLFKDSLQLALNSDKPLVHLLDLEEYAEAWFSTSLIKTYFLRTIRNKIEQLVELGVQLPATYYEIDEITGEYIPKYKTATATKLQKSGSFSFTVSSPVIPKADKLPKPIRDNFPDVLSYVKAVTIWTKS